MFENRIQCDSTDDDAAGMPKLTFATPWHMFEAMVLRTSPAPHATLRSPMGVARTHPDLNFADGA